MRVASYFVMEHLADHCDAYPEIGSLEFRDVYAIVEVDGKPLRGPVWKAVQWNSACRSQALVKDPRLVHSCIHMEFKLITALCKWRNDVCVD